MLLRMALFFLNYPVRISQKSCRATKKTDYSLFAKTDMHLWYGIKGSVDKKLSKNLGALKASGYPFAVKIFTDLGHGGLAGEHPEQFEQEVSAAHGKSLAGKSEGK